MFTYFNEAEPAIQEGLIVPLYDTGKEPIGTLWIVSHSEAHHFDPTDLRVLEQLAVQLVLAIKLRRKAQIRAALELAVQDRDVLVDEVRHRVKNMVQMTTSLLSMQEKAASSQEARTALREAQNRLSVLAGVYETLLAPKADGINVMLPRLIGSLVSALTRSTPHSGHVDVELDCADVTVDVTTATSLGMIVNEAVTNALKYAYVDRSSGRLRVQLSASGDRWLLLINDDGPGFVQAPREGSLGMRLMKGLARQLNGRLTIDGSSGTTVSLSWTPRMPSLQPRSTEAVLARL